MTRWATCCWATARATVSWMRRLPIRCGRRADISNMCAPGSAGDPGRHAGVIGGRRAAQVHGVCRYAGRCASSAGQFSLPDANPITERWRDLLLAEHHALAMLGSAGMAAARSWIVDHGGQRFLEVEALRPGGQQRPLRPVLAQRAGGRIRRQCPVPWPVLVERLASQGRGDAGGRQVTRRCLPAG